MTVMKIWVRYHGVTWWDKLGTKGRLYISDWLLLRQDTTGDLVKCRKYTNTTSSWSLPRWSENHNVTLDRTGHFSGQVSSTELLVPRPSSSALCPDQYTSITFSLTCVCYANTSHVVNKTGRERVLWGSGEGQNSAPVYMQSGPSQIPKVARTDVAKRGITPRTSHDKRHENSCLSDCRSSEQWRINIGCYS
jgi:hypothetical protein